MRIHEGVPIKRFPSFKRFENIVVDSTSLNTYKKCARLYLFERIFHLASPQQPLYFSFGKAYHKLREVLEIQWKAEPDRAIRKTKEFKEQAFVVAAGAALSLFTKETSNIDFTADDKFGFLNQQRLMESMAVVFQEWCKEKDQDKFEVLSVETAFAIGITLYDGTDAELGGRFDQIVKWNRRIWGLDFKTSSKDLKYYDRSIDPNLQFSLYTWAERQLSGGDDVAGQIVDVLYNAKVPPSTKVTKDKWWDNFGPKRQIFLAPRTQKQLDDFEHDAKFTIEQMKISRERDHYPMNETQCVFCKFRSACTKPNDNAIEAKLESEFTVRVWDHADEGTE